MMNPFPELFELISFFETEPEGRGRELSFVKTRDGDRIECDISPTESILKVRWFENDIERLNLDLAIVKGLRVEDLGKKGEIMRATLVSEAPDVGRVLVIRLKPSIHIQFEIGRNT